MGTGWGREGCLHSPGHGPVSSVQGNMEGDFLFYLLALEVVTACLLWGFP